MSHTYRNLCRNQEQSFFKKDWNKFLSPPAFVVFCTLYTEHYHSRKADTGILIYFKSSNCSAFFLSHAFLEAIFLLQVVIWSIF